MDKIVVDVKSQDPERYTNVERAVFEDNAARFNLEYLIKNVGIDNQRLEMYADRSERKHIEKSMKSEMLAQEFLPDELAGKAFNFEYDFFNGTITYTAGTNEYKE